MAQVPFHLAFPVSDLRPLEIFSLMFLDAQLVAAQTVGLILIFLVIRWSLIWLMKNITLRQPTRLTVNKSRRATSGCP